MWYDLTWIRRYSKPHFAPRNTFFPQHTLLPRAHCYLEHFVFCVPERAKFVEENILQSKIFQFQRLEFSGKQNVPGSKLFLEANWCSDQNILRSKMFWGAKYESEKCAKEQSVPWIKVCGSLLFCARHDAAIPTDFPVELKNSLHFHTLGRWLKKT